MSIVYTKKDLSKLKNKEIYILDISKGYFIYEGVLQDISTTNIWIESFYEDYSEDSSPFSPYSSEYINISLKELSNYIIGTDKEEILEHYKTLLPKKFHLIEVKTYNSNNVQLNLTFYLESLNTPKIGDKVLGSYYDKNLRKESYFIGSILNIKESFPLYEDFFKYICINYKFKIKKVHKIISESEYNLIYHAFTQKDKNPLEIVDFLDKKVIECQLSLYDFKGDTDNITLYLTLKDIENLKVNSYIKYKDIFVGKVVVIKNLYSDERIKLLNINTDQILNIDLISEKTYNEYIADISSKSAKIADLKHF